jgi:hypothetical protein
MQPEDFGLNIPTGLREDRYREGFARGLVSTVPENLRKSYAEGFRAARILSRKIRRDMGFIDLPMEQQFAFRMIDNES